jgi:hypothetical protein
MDILDFWHEPKGGKEKMAKKCKYIQGTKRKGRRVRKKHQKHEKMLSAEFSFFSM